MNEENKYPPAAAGGKSIPAANPSSAYGQQTTSAGASPIPFPAKAKPPVVAAAGATASSPSQIPAAASAFAQPTGQPGAPGSFAPKPAPPVPTPRNTKALPLIIGIVVAIPLCLIVACGVAGYLI